MAIQEIQFIFLKSGVLLQLLDIFNKYRREGSIKEVHIPFKSIQDPTSQYYR